MKTEKLPSGNYRVRVTWTENGTRHSRSFTAPTASEVKKAAAAFRATVGDCPAASALSVGEALAAYVRLKEPVLSPSTVREYERYARLYYSSIRNRRVSDLTPEAVQREVSDLSRRLSPKTVRNAYGLLTAALKVYRPGFSPEARLPQKKPRQIAIPSAEEVSAILGRLDGEPRLAVMLAAFQGLRMSEVAGLRWSDVDLEKRTLSVSRALVRGRDNEYFTKAPKTRAGNRSVRLLAPVVDKLRETPRAGDQLFTLSPNALKSAYNRAVRSLGLSYSFHELRHYACSVMLSLGIPPKYVADALGHESTVMVDRVYGHIMSGAADAYADRLDAFYRSGGKL